VTKLCTDLILARQPNLFRAPSPSALLSSLFALLFLIYGYCIIITPANVSLIWITPSTTATFALPDRATGGRLRLQHTSKNNRPFPYLAMRKLSSSHSCSSNASFPTAPSIYLELAHPVSYYDDVNKRFFERPTAVYKSLG